MRVRVGGKQRILCSEECANNARFLCMPAAPAAELVKRDGVSWDAIHVGAAADPVHNHPPSRVWGVAVLGEHEGRGGRGEAAGWEEGGRA